MKNLSPKVKITSSRDVKTIIHLVFSVYIENPATGGKKILHKEVDNQFHLSKELIFNKQETVTIQNFRFVINDTYQEISNGHLYKHYITKLRKVVVSEKKADQSIVVFNKFYNDILRGLKGAKNAR